MAALVLFGGGGDLAMRMLLPSLYFLDHDGLLPDDLKIIGAARSEETPAEYIAKVRQTCEAKAKADNVWDETVWARMEARLDYLAVDATSAESLKPLKDKVGEGSVTSFLAVSPSLYARIVTAMRAAEVPSVSYTARMIAEGPKRLAQKVGEEGVETALAGVAGPDEEVASEAADLIYHLLVLLRSRHMVFQDVLDVLAKRARPAKDAT